MIAIAKYHDVLKKLGLETFDAMMQAEGELVANHRGRREILKISPPGTPTLFLKRVFRAKKKDGLKSFLKRGAVFSSSKEEWENLTALRGAGFKIPELVAYGEECAFFWEKRSFILTQQVAARETLEDFLRDCPVQSERWRVLAALADEIRRLHATAFSLPDLFARHIFVDRSRPSPEFYFIDLARLNRSKHPSVRRRAHDLAALCNSAPLRLCSIRERLRFLCNYSRQDRRALLLRIEKRMRHLAKRRSNRNDFSSVPNHCSEAGRFGARV